MNNLKRILIIALCSILCVCTVPQFSSRSCASSYAISSLYYTLLNLSGYLTTRGYSIVHEYGSPIPSLSELRDMSYDKQSQLLLDIASKLDDFGASHNLPGAGQQFVKRMEAAALSGAITLNPSLRDIVDLWLSSTTSSGEIVVGQTVKSFSDFSYDSDYRFTYSSNGWSEYNTFPSDTIAVFWYSNSRSLYFLPKNKSDFILNLNDGFFEYVRSSGNFGRDSTATYEGVNYRITSAINVPSYNFKPFIVNSLPPGETVLSAYLKGYFDDLTQPGVNIVSKQITDTSSSDLLTSTNTIASDGTIEGDTTIYLPSVSEYEQLIDDYNNQSISYEDFINALGINSVSDTATVEEKESALEVVVTPSDDYLWFTKTQWGADSLEETRKASASTRSEEDSLADSIANTANGGSDPEDPDNKSRGKGLLALLLLGLGFWNTPIIAGDGTPSGGGTDDSSGDGSDDSSGYLTESIAGMAVAGSLIDDLFDSAGGSNGYGLIYTVGASFVIFSVIIGAANYFGALFHGSDTKQNNKASGKRSTPGKVKKGG